MRNINIIHFVERNTRHPWLEKLIVKLDEKGFTQAFLTIEPPGEIHAFFANANQSIKVDDAPRKRLTILMGVNQLRKLRLKESTNIVHALGHPASFITGVASCFMEIQFVLCHMQQPRYFKFMNSKLRSIVHSFAYKFYVRRASRIISFSLEIAEVLATIGNYEKKIVPIPIGIDFEKIKKQQLSIDLVTVIPNGAPRILMVGRLSQEKNYKLALEAFGYFLKNYPNALLSIAGEGSQKKEMIDLAKSLDIAERVQFLGFVENIPALMAKFDLLLHLATTEGYGQIYLEALLSGLPVLCSRTGIAIDFVENKEQNLQVIHSLSARDVSQELIKYFAEHKENNIVTSEQFAHFYRHEDTFVYEEIAEIFQNLSKENTL